MLKSFALGVCLFALGAHAQPLSPRNLEAPFCYLPGGERSWPVGVGAVSRAAEFRLSAVRGGTVLARGVSSKLRFDLLDIEVTREGKLKVAVPGGSARPRFDLRIEVFEAGKAVQEQTLEIMPAPPERPLAYYADFGDDLINIYGIGAGARRPLLHHQLREDGPPAGRAVRRNADALVEHDKQGFDQYFRRMQCQGVAKEILWLTPFPLLTDARSYDARDWKEFTEQGKALLRSRELASLAAGAGKHTPWGWIRDLTAFRLNPALHKALSDSAVEHGIRLALSYRPFEQALSKYYEVPAFDADGNFLWFYRPAASPSMAAHPERVGFAHYREVLRELGRGDEGEPAEIELPNAGNAREFLARYRAKGNNLRVLAARFAPMQSDSLVLVRRKDGRYDLVPWRGIRERAESKRIRITGFEAVHEEGRGVRLKGVRLPPDCSHIVIDNPSGEAALVLDTRDPVRLRNRRGIRLGRNAAYFSYDETTPERKKTLSAGITPDGGYHTAFFATQEGVRFAYRAGAGQPLRGAVLVVQRGERFSTEMVDFTRRAAREAAIREIRGVMRYPAFRSLYVNTRSHTQLAADSRDGADGVRLAPYYDAPRRATAHLGLDLAYAPARAAANERLRAASSEEIANHRTGEWTGFCQSGSCGYPWRLARNAAVAEGIRSFLLDLRKAFPDTEIQVVLPEREGVAEAVREAAGKLPPGMTSYAAGRYNYIQNIGEGMTMLDLSGTNAAPVLLGVGAFTSPEVLEAYLKAALRDMEGHRRSAFRGPVGVMFEGQYGLRKDGGAAREAILCRMLAESGRIGEVVLYEAADWTYRLPWDGFDFLDRCGARAVGR